MTASNRHSIAIGLLLVLALPACHSDMGEDALTIEGGYTGTTASSCQLALRSAGDWKLVDARAVAPSFREQFAVEARARRYYVEIHCPDGKAGTGEEFDFAPPRASISLGTMQLE
jgi:hypothetical protein